MSREILSALELVDRLNIELRKNEECRDCQFDHIVRRSHPDEHGCNWEEPILRCGGPGARECLATARKVVAEMQRSFNVEERH